MWLSELKLRGWSDTEFKKKKNLAQDPGAVTRDVIPGFRNTAHSRRLARETSREPSWACTHRGV